MLILFTLILGACSNGKTSPSPSPTIAVTEDPNKKLASLYQLNDYSQMMSYVIQTTDGKIIVIDGGYDRNAIELLNFLRELQGVDKPEIEAWFLTHCHQDHIMAFVTLVKEYKEDFIVKKVYYNFPSGDYIKTYEEDVHWTFLAFNEAKTILGDDKFQLVEIGDKLKVDNILFEIWLTPDESIKQNIVNESSLVIRAQIGQESILFLADLGEQGGFRLRRMYKEELKSDVVQMAHHGSNGVAFIIYDMIGPRVCLWPTPEWLFNNDNGTGYNKGPWETVYLYEHMTKQLGVSRHLISKDGLLQLDFPLDD